MLKSKTLRDKFQFVEQICRSFPRYDIKCGIMQISGFYRVKKHPPHSKRGGCFFMFVKILNLMTLVKRDFLF